MWFRAHSHANAPMGNKWRFRFVQLKLCGESSQTIEDYRFSYLSLLFWYSDYSVFEQINFNTPKCFFHWRWVRNEVITSKKYVFLSVFFSHKLLIASTKVIASFDLFSGVADSKINSPATSDVPFFYLQFSFLSFLIRSCNWISLLWCSIPIGFNFIISLERFFYFCGLSKMANVNFFNFLIIHNIFFAFFLSWNFIFINSYLHNFYFFFR